VREDVELPDAFVEHAVVPASPLELPADEIDENRDRWVARWTEIVVR
jgi:thiamine transport system substrate-binding protein